MARPGCEALRYGHNTPIRLAGLHCEIMREEAGKVQDKSGESQVLGYNQLMPDKNARRLRGAYPHKNKQYAGGAEAKN